MQIKSNVDVDLARGTTPTKVKSCTLLCQTRTLFGLVKLITDLTRTSSCRFYDRTVLTVCLIKTRIYKQSKKLEDSN